jgi:hypothetical protein
MEWLIPIRWIVGGAALAIGAFASLGNLITLINVIVTKGSTSFIPFLGGTIGFLGLLVIPFPGRFPWLWVPLVVDFGCIPMWSLVGIAALTGRLKRKDSSEQHAGQVSSEAVRSASPNEPSA